MEPHVRSTAVRTEDLRRTIHRDGVIDDVARWCCPTGTIVRTERSLSTTWRGWRGVVRSGHAGCAIWRSRARSCTRAPNSPEKPGPYAAERVHVLHAGLRLGRPASAAAPCLDPASPARRPAPPGCVVPHRCGLLHISRVLVANSGRSSGDRRSGYPYSDSALLDLLVVQAEEHLTSRSCRDPRDRRGPIIVVYRADPACCGCRRRPSLRATVALAVRGFVHRFDDAWNVAATTACSRSRLSRTRSATGRRRCTPSALQRRNHLRHFIDVPRLAVLLGRHLAVPATATPSRSKDQ